MALLPDPWVPLRELTEARIALGRAGASQPTSAHLAFQLDHARARDAVHQALDLPALVRDLEAAGLSSLQLHSAAPDRPAYLRRPDLGRRLDPPSAAALDALPRTPWDLAMVVADGLSAPAVQAQAAPLLALLLPPLVASGWRVAPPVLVAQGRVAVGDEIGERMGAGMVLVLLGERPGLSACHSLGAYLTWAPRVGLRDADRNCISNIRPGGLDLATAAHRLLYLIREARRLGFSGVALKENAGLPALPGDQD